ncbi:hypothetical protein GA0115240_11718 [Streptomyces sp. DvalAA-14]|uniref:hypothetical protein n=1 Tax=unclassified Streptomyces TaxID=2593676 RepID=UPI00081AF4D8|nr:MULTISPECIES: hypothetical protein [unclassified Streptomyces]MYS20175.1 hypothetical protein [Streptomyces sp. SID4948]SCD62599.1 hypothetical protein GA0115240_11718 [Streptomyces sp. DvalAA-14]
MSDQGVVINTKRKGLAAAGVVALIAAGSAACGTAQATPAGKVQNAFTKLSDQKSLTLGVSFGASADQIWSAMKGEDDFSKADAQMLAALHAQVAVSSDKPLGQLKSGDKTSSFGILLSDDASAKKNLIEIRSVGGKLYLRGDVKELAKLGAADGDDSSDAQGLNGFLSDADKLPASMGAIKSALQGDWISIDPAAFAGLAKTFGGAAGVPTATPTLDPASQAQILTGLRNAVAHNAKFKDLGNRDGADHIQLTVPARPFAKDLATSVSPALTKLPGFKQSDVDKALKDVPNRTVSADLAIKNGMISAVTVDLAQFDTQAHGQLPLKLTLDGGAAPVSAPAGAKELKPQDLLGMFAGVFAGQNGTSSLTGSDASIGSGALPDLSDLKNTFGADKKYDGATGL